MSVDYEISEYMHNSIYSKSSIDKPYSNRKANVYFSEPDEGINEDTGILLIIAGFGGNARSNVYKKMRKQFSDKYNLVTIQCDYFGYEFMQQSQTINKLDLNVENISKIFSHDEINQIYNKGKLDINKLMEIGSKYNVLINLKEDLDTECLENFNDMGIMQALDNIVAVLKVMAIIYENGYSFNTKKVIIYGQSQGAYLSYLCNRFCPTLFSHIIDNSAWLYPQYLLSNRYLNYSLGKLNLQVEFEYLAKKLNLNNKIFDLNFLYSNFDNNCYIVIYHGVTDSLIPSFDKKEFSTKIKECIYNEITQDKVDGEIFKSTSHGLDANFLKLFDYTMDRLEFKKTSLFYLPEKVSIDSNKEEYCIDYTDILPILIRHK